MNCFIYRDSGEPTDADRSTCLAGSVCSQFSVEAGGSLSSLDFRWFSINFVDYLCII